MHGQEVSESPFTNTILRHLADRRAFSFFCNQPYLYVGTKQGKNMVFVFDFATIILLDK